MMRGLLMLSVWTFRVILMRFDFTPAMVFIPS